MRYGLLKVISGSLFLYYLREIFLFILRTDKRGL